jgi:hypothetical protein
MIGAPIRFVKTATLSISDVVHFENDPHPPLLLREATMYPLPPNEQSFVCFRELGTMPLSVRIAVSSSLSTCLDSILITRPQLFKRHCREILNNPMLFLLHHDLTKLSAIATFTRNL